MDISPDAFKAFLPAFNAVPNDTIQLYLDVASGEVDNSWPASSRKLATMYLAAHRMTLSGIGGSPEAQFGSFKRLKVSSLELERQTSNNEPLRGTVLSTSYGVMYNDLVKLNFPSILAV